MPAKHEIEVKFEVDGVEALARKLAAAGFCQITPRTHETNVLYDLPDGRLRRRGALLRIREYGSRWTVTYKDRSRVRPGRHKSRREIETTLQDGRALGEVLRAAGFRKSFAYEKFRSEWGDGTGQVVIDETPIGNFAEIEGPPDWIDRTARLLRIAKNEYITASYSELFQAWKRKTQSKAAHMLFPR